MPIKVFVQHLKKPTFFLSFFFHISGCDIMWEKKSCGKPINKLNLVGSLGLGMEQKKIRQENRKMLREENWEKDEQLQLLSGNQK